MKYLVICYESSFELRTIIHRPFDRYDTADAIRRQQNYAAKVFQIRRKDGVTASIRQRDDNHTAPQKLEIFRGFASEF